MTSHSMGGKITVDVAGPFDNMTENWQKIGSRAVATTVAPHLNHRQCPRVPLDATNRTAP